MDLETAIRWGYEDAEMIVSGTMGAEFSRVGSDMTADAYGKLARVQHYIRAEWRKLLWPSVYA